MDFYDEEDGGGDDCNDYHDDDDTHDDGVTVVIVFLPDIYNLVRIFPSNASLFLAYETTKKFLAEEKLDK